MLNFEVSQSPAVVSSCSAEGFTYDLPLLPSKFVHWVTLQNQLWTFNQTALRYLLVNAFWTLINLKSSKTRFCA